MKNPINSHGPHNDVGQKSTEQPRWPRHLDLSKYTLWCLHAYRHTSQNISLLLHNVWLYSMVPLKIRNETKIPDLPMLLSNVLYWPTAFFSFLVRLGFELRAWCLQSRCSSAWATPPVHFSLVIVEMGVFQALCWFFKSQSPKKLGLQVWATCTWLQQPFFTWQKTGKMKTKIHMELKMIPNS
jgi:hypothetical protein